MSKVKRPFDLEGQIFGRWTLLKGKFKGYYRYYTCQCECGTVKDVRESSITGGDSTSCGCLAREAASQRLTRHLIEGQPITKHRLYQRWANLNRRCYNSKSKDFHHYGGRGIGVCDRWRDTLPNYKGFENFLEDMEDSFSEGLEIDRVYNEGNYSPENCKWATRQEQVVNSRRLLGEDTLIHYKGKSLLASQWEIETGIRSQVIRDRINKLGWDIEKALNTPMQVKRKKVKWGDRYINFTKLFTNYTNICASLVGRGISIEYLVYFLFRLDIYYEINKELYKQDISAEGLTQDDFDFTIRLSEVAEEILYD